MLKNLVTMSIIFTVLVSTGAYGNGPGNKPVLDQFRNRTKSTGESNKGTLELRLDKEVQGFKELSPEAKRELIPMLEKIDLREQDALAKAFLKAKEAGLEQNIIKLLKAAESAEAADAKTVVKFISKLGESEVGSGERQEVFNKLMELADALPEYMKTNKILDGETINNLSQGAKATTYRELIEGVLQISTTGNPNPTVANDALSVLIRLLGKERIENLKRCTR